MQRSKRLKTIIHAVRAPGGARVADLVAATGVAPMTVRRDLAELERQGILRRVHGGATSVPSRGEHLPYAVRLASHTGAKASIARACAGLVPEGASVIVDDGSTCAAVARELAGRDLTVLAMSVHVAAALGARAGTRIVTPGGRLDPDELSWVGATAVDAVRAFRADVAVLGVCGWEVSAGLTSSTLEDAEVKRAVLVAAALPLTATAREAMPAAIVPLAAAHSRAARRGPAPASSRGPARWPDRRPDGARARLRRLVRGVAARGALVGGSAGALAAPLDLLGLVVPVVDDGRRARARQPVSLLALTNRSRPAAARASQSARWWVSSGRSNRRQSRPRE